MRHLVRANLEQNPEKVADVIGLLAPMRDAWATAVAQVSGQGA